MVTESKQLYDAINREKRTPKKRLLIDIKSGRENYKTFQSSATRLVRGDQNPGNGLAQENGIGASDLLLHAEGHSTKVEF